MTSTAPKKSRFSIVRVLVVLGVVLGVALVVGMISFQHGMAQFAGRSKQSEVKALLKTAFISERQYFEEHKRYSTSLAEVGFPNMGGDRYVYLFDSHGELAPGSGEPSPDATGLDADRAHRPDAPPVDPSYRTRIYAGNTHLGTQGTCPECDIVMAAYGNVDSDPTLDVWSVATFDRTGPKGEKIPAGVPYNDVNDVEQ